MNFSYAIIKLRLIQNVTLALENIMPILISVMAYMCIVIHDNLEGAPELLPWI